MLSFVVMPPWTSSWGRYDLNDEDIANWLPIINSLHDTLVEVQPRPAFKRQLRNELLKQPIGVRVRLRPLPTRVQLAAVLTHRRRLRSDCLQLVHGEYAQSHAQPGR